MNTFCSMKNRWSTLNPNAEFWIPHHSKKADAHWTGSFLQQIVHSVEIILVIFWLLDIEIAVFKYNFTVVSPGKTTGRTARHQTCYVISTFAHVTFNLSSQGSKYELYVGCLFFCMFLWMFPCLLFCMFLWTLNWHRSFQPTEGAVKTQERVYTGA